MAWQGTGDNASTESSMTKFYDVIWWYMCIQVYDKHKQNIIINLNT